MSRVLTRRRTRPTRLDFDGGPWVGGFPVAWSSPWAELVVACAAGFAAGWLLLPHPAPVQAIGWVGAILASPVAALVMLVDWLVDGTARWPLGTAWLAPMGWGLLSAATADLFQATLPVTFGRRVVVAAVGGPVVAVALVGLLSMLPWHLLPWAG